jgi:hypothetical protein
MMPACSPPLGRFISAYTANDERGRHLTTIVAFERLSMLFVHKKRHTVSGWKTRPA